MWGRKKRDCTRDGHKFEPRYDVEPGRLRLHEGGDISHAALEMLIEAATKRTYVCDICVYCGQIVQKPKG